jgi:hypothetical protein
MLLLIPQIFVDFPLFTIGIFQSVVLDPAKQWLPNQNRRNIHIHCQNCFRSKQVLTVSMMMIIIIIIIIRAPETTHKAYFLVTQTSSFIQVLCCEISCSHGGEYEDGCSWLLRTDDGSSKHLWNVVKRLPDYTAQQPRRQQSSGLVL